MITFRFKKFALPVINVEDYDQACHNFDIALDAAVDGVLSSTTPKFWKN
ncbi:MAG: hypothetical protein PHX74_10515 [Candidatus Sumerlaeales bacterium]|nr:hypothetical protein [Candidatus Sumerlaeales bacterium]